MNLRRLGMALGLLVASVSLVVHAAVYGKATKLSSTDKIDFRRATLLQAYYQALKSDPTFKRATSDWESAKENLPIARAAYLTQVALTGNAQRQYNRAVPQLSLPDENGYNYDYGFILTVSQPVFNLPAWDAIKSARATVKAATATYTAASQDLMVRTVRAYLEVLQAFDQLRFQLARKRAVLEQLNVTRQQFKVGLIAITGVYDARSVYDQAVAASIADQNTLNDAVERLAEITGIHYLRLRGIGQRVPLVTPTPNDINLWADVAERQNYSLIAQNYTVIAARDTLKQQSTSWMPQLNLSGQYINDNQSTLHESRFVVPAIRTNNVLYGFTLNFPIIQGGLVTANTRQARYNYLSASDQREFIYRSVISNTRQSFLGVITGISKVKADWQSVISAQNALNATKAGYEVGTRTIVDVLDDVTSLYLEQQRYTDDQYIYILDSIELKFNAGTLSVDDIKRVNSWLKQNIKLNLPEVALKSLETRLRPIKPFPNIEPPFHKKMQQRMKDRKPDYRTPPVTRRHIIKMYGPSKKAIAARKRWETFTKHRWSKHRTVPVTSSHFSKHKVLRQKYVIHLPKPLGRFVKRSVNRLPKPQSLVGDLPVPMAKATRTSRIKDRFLKRAYLRNAKHKKQARKKILSKTNGSKRPLALPKSTIRKACYKRVAHKRKLPSTKGSKRRARIVIHKTLSTPATLETRALHRAKPVHRQPVSLDERIIPLYETPSGKEGALPSPS